MTDSPEERRADTLELRYSRGGHREEKPGPEQRIVGALRQIGGGATVKEVWRKLGVTG